MNKKVCILAVVLVLLLALSACGKKNEGSEPAIQPEGTPAPAAEPTAVPTAAPTEIPGDIGTVDLDDSEPVEEGGGMVEVTGKPETEAPEPTAKAEETMTPEQPEEDPVIPDMDDVPVQEIEPEAVGHVPNSTTYENYLNMSGTEQVAFIESFGSPADFASWFNAAQAEYEVVSDPIEITTGVIDFGADKDDSAE